MDPLTIWLYCILWRCEVQGKQTIQRKRPSQMDSNFLQIDAGSYFEGHKMKGVIFLRKTCTLPMNKMLHKLLELALVS